MNKYYVLDSAGFLFNAIDCGKPPEGAVLVDFDIGTAPTIFHKFHYASRTWVDSYPDELRLGLESAKARSKRSSLLTASDWTQMPDVALETKELWAVYRQALRDITNQSGFPFDIVWPTPPG